MLCRTASAITLTLPLPLGSRGPHFHRHGSKGAEGLSKTNEPLYHKLALALLCEHKHE